MIKKYIRNSNISLLNTIYLYPKKIEEKKWTKGSIIIIYRDLNTMEKHMEIIDDPEYEYYMLKEGEKAAKNALYIEDDKVDKITCKYRSRERDIAKRTDNTEWFKDEMYRNSYSVAKRKIHIELPNVFSSDRNIEDYYRFKFNNIYKNDPYNPTKAYFDIEVDGINQVGDFPTPEDSPVNAITYIDVEHMKIFTLLLRTEGNIDNIEQFEDYMNNQTGYFDLKEFIKGRVGGEEKEKMYRLNEMKYQLLFYDSEISLIADFFKIVNISKPDFIMAWNMRFDLPFLYERIKLLGYNPLEIMCHKDFDLLHKHYLYYIDEDNQKAMSDRGDYCIMSSYSVWIDQMIQFAARRKAKSGKYKNWKLDYIGTKTTKIGKLDFSHITRYIAKLPYLDYKTFVFYNIMDTIVQYCIEFKVQDVEYLFNKCLINNTRYSKCHNQTVYLVNRATKEFYEKGLIICNNKNKMNSKPEEKYPGAHVADPAKINPYSKYKINGLPIMVFANLDDFDYKAMYPRIQNEFNIGSNTQVGRIFIPNKVFDNENPYEAEKFCRAGKYIEDFHSHNYIEFCSRWFSLAGFKDLCRDIQEFYNKKENPTYLPKKTFDGKRVMIHYQNQEKQNKHMIKYMNNKPKITRLYKIEDESYNIRDNIDIDKIVYREG